MEKNDLKRELGHCNFGIKNHFGASTTISNRNSYLVRNSYLYKNAMDPKI